MVRRKKPGRSKGRRNRGYFYRKGRGWFTSADEKLCDSEGNHLRTPDDHETAALAYARYCTAQAESLPTPVDDSIVADLCGRYLEHARRVGAHQTYRMRADFLFDFCSGFPARFRDCPEKATASDRIHRGYGNYRWNQLRKINVEDWLAAHPRWKSAGPQCLATRRRNRPLPCPLSPPCRVCRQICGIPAGKRPATRHGLLQPIAIPWSAS
jgi:hypothetical protein